MHLYTSPENSKQALCWLCVVATAAADREKIPATNFGNCFTKHKTSGFETSHFPACVCVRIERVKKIETR